MNRSRLAALVAALPLLFLLPSCARLTAWRDAAGSKVSELSRQSLAAIDRLRPARVPVVEVRKKDLKEMPLGHERALAYTEKQRNSWWFFSGPVDFKEPVLPDAATESTGSLLPPKDEIPAP
jgi:hypothetical protein